MVQDPGGSILLNLNPLKLGPNGCFNARLGVHGGHQKHSMKCLHSAQQGESLKLGQHEPTARPQNYIQSI